jgi:hypothetical protein
MIPDERGRIAIVHLAQALGAPHTCPVCGTWWKRHWCTHLSMYLDSVHPDELPDPRYKLYKIWAATVQLHMEWKQKHA